MASGPQKVQRRLDLVGFEAYNGPRKLALQQGPPSPECLHSSSNPGARAADRVSGGRPLCVNLRARRPPARFLPTGIPPAVPAQTAKCGCVAGATKEADILPQRSMEDGRENARWLTGGTAARALVNGPRERATGAAVHLRALPASTAPSCARLCRVVVHECPATTTARQTWEPHRAPSLCPSSRFFFSGQVHAHGPRHPVGLCCPTGCPLPTYGVAPAAKR